VYNQVKQLLQELLMLRDIYCMEVTMVFLAEHTGMLTQGIFLMALFRDKETMDLICHLQEKSFNMMFGIICMAETLREVLFRLVLLHENMC